MKEQIKAPEKIQLKDEEIAHLSDAQFKTLVIRMLTEMVEYGHKMEEKVKAMKSEIKENVQGTNRDGKQHPNHRGARRRRGRARNGKLIGKNNEGELPQSGKGNRLPGSPGSSESQRSWTHGSTHQGTS